MPEWAGLLWEGTRLKGHLRTQEIWRPRGALTFHLVARPHFWILPSEHPERSGVVELFFRHQHRNSPLQLFFGGDGSTTTGKFPATGMTNVFHFPFFLPE